MVMKQGSKLEREKLSGGRHDQKNLHAGDESADFDAEGGVEEQVHHMGHPAMQTRHSHPHEHKHSDGRKHEDDHHAVKRMKG